MKYLIYVLLLFPLCLPARTITLPSPQTITVVNADGIDVAATGAEWFIHVGQQEWVVSGKRLYPVWSDVTPVIQKAMDNAIDEFDKYLKEALVAEEYTVKKTGTGLALVSVSSFDYIAFRFKNGKSCKVYFRQNNQEHSFLLFETIANETTAATAARNRLQAELNKISASAKAGGHIK